MRPCEQLQKFCEHQQASTHEIFASNSSKVQILRPFYTPTHNSRGHFAHCSYIFPRPSGARKNTTQLAKYPRILYVKPSNKMYIFPSLRPVCFIVSELFVETCHTILQSFVWRRHIGVPQFVMKGLSFFFFVI